MVDVVTMMHLGQQLGNAFPDDLFRTVIEVDTLLFGRGGLS